MSGDLPSLKTARVFAPGMTCVYHQLFDGYSDRPWIAYPFKEDAEGAANRLDLAGRDPVDVMSDLIAGDIASTADIFVQADAILREHGPRIEYDILAVESRWLMYGASLLSFTDWARFERNLAMWMGRQAYYFEVEYPHLGSVFDQSLVRTCTQEDVARWRARSDLKHRLLDVLSKFRTFTYVDVAAAAGYVGYERACSDQMEHYTASFTQHVRTIFSQDVDAEPLDADNRRFARLLRRIAGRRVDVEYVRGMAASTPSNALVLSLRLVVTPDDPLICPLELLLSWRTRGAVEIDWSGFSVSDGVFRWSDADLPPVELISYVHRIIRMKTMGRCAFEMTE